MPEASLRPGLLAGHYPQRRDSWPGALEAALRSIVSAPGVGLRAFLKPPGLLVWRVNRRAKKLSKMTAPALLAERDRLREALYRKGLKSRLVAHSFALIREASYRQLGIRHFDEQLLGGWAIVNGRLAEMATGEGKTLTTLLPACTAAMAGIPVHVLTANDYLASRDHALLKPVYDWLGITSASIAGRVEIADRAKAYRCDVVHTTSQQVAFDYLRDRITMGREIGALQVQFQRIADAQLRRPPALLLRGLCFAILDEADSLLIDEARTPLIISAARQGEDPNRFYNEVLEFAGELTRDLHFTADTQNRRVALTPAGKQKLDTKAQAAGGQWLRRQCEMHVITALKALHLYRIDVDYVVREGRVDIVDAMTGRAMPDRSWEQGLHQMIELKEQCELTTENDPLAKIAYQTFFKRYLRLSGMSGTLDEVSAELRQVYGLRTVAIPTHLPGRREIDPAMVFRNAESKWAAVLADVRQRHQAGQPVLIGVRTVVQSRRLSELLAQAELPHQVLNAEADQAEAEMVAAAGQRGCITVATNMAGRGTDIALGASVAELGGLHVLCAALNDSARVDRQLFGRCARQGDPGSAQVMLSLEDDGIADFYPGLVLRVLRIFAVRKRRLPLSLGLLIARLPQRAIEKQHARQRKLLTRSRQAQLARLSFAGRAE